MKTLEGGLTLYLLLVYVAALVNCYEPLTGSILLPFNLITRKIEYDRILALLRPSHGRMRIMAHPISIWLIIAVDP